MRKILNMILRRVKEAESNRPRVPEPAVGRDKAQGPPYLTRDLDNNLKIIFDIAGRNPDLIVRHMEINLPGEARRCALLFLDEMVDSELMGSMIIEPVLKELPQVIKSRRAYTSLVDVIEKNVLTIPGVRQFASVSEIIGEVLRGNSALLLDKENKALICANRAYEVRSVEEPTLETVVRGPKEGFTESLSTNMALLRRKIAGPNLRFDQLWIGKYSQTRVAVTYIYGIADRGLVEEVKKRVSRISIDGVLDSGYIEQLIEDAPYSLFPTVGNTEKPDVVAARLLEGKVAVLVDGSPVALTVPRLFYETIQTPEDYYSRPYNSSVLRIIRLFFFISTVVLPGFYVAVVNYHPELIPRRLIITMAGDREGVPLPLVLEVVVFGIIFEGLREAGVRMPRAVGSAITIVGALLIGQATVDAGLVTSSTVIVTAFVGIAGFITPGLTDIFIIIRFFLVFLSGVLGISGLIMGILVLYAHMCSLRSFGVPYMAPIAPLNFSQLKDVYIRAPLWHLTTRPSFIAKENRRRMKEGLKPEPPEKGNNSSRK